MRKSIFPWWLIFLLPGVALADQKHCEDLIDLKLQETTITLAETVAAGDFTAPDGQTYTVPAFCRVRGAGRPSADSNINAEVWLPLDNWNGRYYQVGNGGSSGSDARPTLPARLGRHPGRRPQ
jgi:feruloyl esterase